MKFLSLLLACAFWVQASPALAEGMRFIRDAEIEQDLKIMTRGIFDAAGLSSDTVRFVLIEDSDLNAFVAGGQNIFINTGLVLKTETPDELLGVIAHESGHIASGHLFRAKEELEDISLQSMLANLLGVAAAIGTRTPGVGMAVGSAGQTIALRSLLRHTRIQESAADSAGVRFLSDSGLPLSGFVSFMEKLGSQELLPESQQSEYVRTHPLTADRVDFLKNEAARHKSGSVPPAWNDMHARIKAKLEGYLYPDRALKETRVSLPIRYAKAIAWYRKGEIAKALDLLEGLIREEPSNAYFHELKGQILFENGHADAAVLAYAQAVRHAPGAGLIRSAYGHALLERKNAPPDDAIRALKSALETEPRSAMTHHLLAIAYGKNKQEGLSRLHLAEEAMLQGKFDNAKREAMMARAALPEKSPGRLRTDDILAEIDKKPAKKLKKKD